MDELKELVLKSFDSELSHNEQQTLESSFSKFPELKIFEEEMLTIRKQLLSLKTTSISKDFIKDIIDSIEPINKDNLSVIISMQKTFRRITYIAAALLLFIFTYNAMQSREITIDSIVGIQQNSIEQDFEDAIASID